MKINVGFLVAYDYDLLRISIPSVYEHADKIVLALDINLNTWSGNKFDVDDSFFKWIKEFDKDSKIEVFKEDFYIASNTAMQNETRERNLLASKMGEGYCLQLDADEFVLDFKSLTEYLKKNESKISNNKIQICGYLTDIYKKVDGGYLFVNDVSSFYLGSYSPNYIRGRKNKNQQKLYIPFLAIHLTWGRSEEELKFKLKNWGHNNDFDTEKFLSFWRGITKENFNDIKTGFHPLNSKSWKKLVFIKGDSIPEIISKNEFPKIIPRKQLLLKNFAQKIKHKLNSGKTKNNDITIDFSEKIVFKPSSKPAVSIIIPFYNQQNFTLNCLKSLEKHLTTKYTYEIILIDDCSPEHVDLDIVEGVKLIRNTTNKGFLKNINKGINEAKGDFIYILNNDTIVKKDFLSELFYVFENFKNVGAVGSKLINADGSLQEAGAVFLKNGKITQIVKNKTVYSPEVNYIYEVDYCSGASLLFKKHQDNGEMNLLDEAFLPAYFEETDFCFRLRHEQNKKIYYTPFSEVIHYDGVSYKSKDNKKSNLKEELFKKNKDVFFHKWDDILKNIQATKTSDRISELNQKSIVFYSKYIPKHDKSSGDNRFNEIVKICLEHGCHLTIMVQKADANCEYINFYRKLGVQVYYKNKSGVNFNKFIKKELTNAHVSWFYGPNSFKSHYNTVKKYCKNTYVIYDMIDIHHLRFQRALKLDPTDSYFKKRFPKYKKIEVSACKKSDLVLAISEKEKQYMQKLLPELNNIDVLSNIHHMKVTKDNIIPFEKRKDLLFIGSKHHPNIDALNYLSNSIMPIVWKSNPEIKVHIVGSVAETITNPTDERIILHGFVPDVSTIFSSVKMMVSPLRIGAGVKGKLGQAFEYALPIVTTEIGAEGMFLINGKNALIADTAQQFSQEIIELNQNKELWNKLCKSSSESLKPFGENQLKRILNTL